MVSGTVNKVIEIWRFAIMAAVIVLALCPALAHADVNILSHSVVATYEVGDSVKSTDSATRIADTACGCHPSIPLEIVASALTVGMIEYWASRVIFDDTFKVQDAGPALIGPALLLYMATLAPVANWTSGCDANAWNTVWIGFLSQAVYIDLYGVIYGFKHVLNIYKFNWPEYLALGVAPTVITSLWYNIFLHPRPPKDEGVRSYDQGMYLLPSVNGDKSVALNFGMRF